MSDFNQFQYQNEYNKQKYDRITIMVPKGKKEQIKNMATAAGMSVNEFLNGIIEAYLRNGDQN